MSDNLVKEVARTIVLVAVRVTIAQIALNMDVRCLIAPVNPALSVQIQALAVVPATTVQIVPNTPVWKAIVNPTRQIHPIGS